MNKGFVGWFDKVLFGDGQEDNRDYINEKKDLEELEVIAKWLLKYDKEFYNMAMREAENIRRNDRERYNRIKGYIANSRKEVLK